MDYEKYRRESIGSSDDAFLIAAGEKVSETDVYIVSNPILFSAGGKYYAYMVDGSVKLPPYFQKVFECDSWLRIYDNNGVSYSDIGGHYEIFRAKDAGCIIRKGRQKMNIRDYMIAEGMRDASSSSTSSTEMKLDRIRCAFSTSEIAESSGMEKINFYARCAGFGVRTKDDADGYAWLNTLFGYDICWNRARVIINHLYRRCDMSALDLDAENKKLMQGVNDRYSLSHDFGNWPDDTPGEISFRY